MVGVAERQHQPELDRERAWADELDRERAWAESHGLLEDWENGRFPWWDKSWMEEDWP